MIGGNGARGRGARLIGSALAAIVLGAAGLPALAGTRPGPARVGPVTDVSQCAGYNAEVEEATAPPGYVYELWIGCDGIGFARSTDGGRRFGPAQTVPGSAGDSWDPALTVARNGAVYVAYMHANGPDFQPRTSMYPVVAASFDHGVTFPRVSADLPPAAGDFGDRDFITAAPDGDLYLTWDYGPSAAEVQLLCDSSGSCAYANGDLNAVIQKSADGGRTWGPITHLEPGFPLGGGYSAPLLAGRDGKIDVLYIGHPTDPDTFALHPGYEFFTSSRDGTHWPAQPLKLWPGKGTLSLSEWWIDGDIGTDAAGNLYATWDTQTPQGDIGWLTFSRDGGRRWSPPVRVTPDRDNAPHIVQVAGGRPGVAYVGWQTSAPAQGYATYLRPFSITRGWLGPAIQVSSQYGNATMWPGDTFGIATLPGPGTRIAMSWGSAIGSSQNSEIYATVVKLPPSR
jgi:hypothetical protein